MVQKESLQPDDWHRRGEADLSAAEILLANEGDTQVDGKLPGESGRHYMRAMDLPEEGDVDDTLGRFTADRPRTGWQWSLLARGIPTARER